MNMRIPLISGVWFAVVLCFMGGFGNELFAARENIVGLQRKIQTYQQEGHDKRVERGRIQIAKIYMEQGLYREAALQWDQVTQLFFKRRERPHLFSLMGSCYEHLRQFDKAIPAYEQSLFWQPKNWRHALNLARIYRLVDLNEKAILYYRDVLNQKPKNFEALTGLAQSYINLSNYDKSLAHAHAAVAVAPEESKDLSLELLASIHHHLGDGHLALDILEGLPETRSRLEQKALLQERLGLWNEAWQTYEHLYKQDSTHIPTVLKMAMVAIQLDRPGKADRLLTIARRDPDWKAQATWLRAYLRWKMGHLNSSLRDVQEVLTMARSDELRGYSKVLQSVLGSRESGVRLP